MHIEIKLIILYTLAMPVPNRKKHYSRSLLLIGITLTLAGGLFLLSSFAVNINLPIIVSILLIIIGGLLVVLTIKLKKSSAYLFLAIFQVVCGVYLLILFTGIFAPSFTFAASWPLISILVGLSLFPAGLRHYKAIKFFYALPAFAFVLLGGVLLLFSTHIVQMSFRQFMLHWWPLIIILSGILLIVLAFSNGRQKKSDNGPL
ncbi:MAG: hypothetical protein Ta2G_11110 [Termitinemataceae bacterium]|nr:MAG: hypothetical protein Ta2G_11110 [Termitinemataceae bacterium]